MLIDTHAHLNFEEYDKDRAEVFKRTMDSDVWMINIGWNYKSSQEAIDYTEQYPQGVFAAVGLHPSHLADQIVKVGEKMIKVKKEIFKQEKYRQLAGFSAKIVALGEIGLDYYRLEGSEQEQQKAKQLQQEVFNSMLILAGDLGLPVILHCREAHRDMLDILKNHKLTGVTHSFTGTEEELQEYLQLGYYIGYNGIITFKKKVDDIKRLVESTPLDKILAETDCPYLSPEPYRGKRNEPAYVKYVAEEIAKLKNISLKEVEKITTKNAKELFNLK